MTKTTEQHFELFKKEVKKYIEEFGLKGWEVSYEHKCKDEDNYSSLRYSMMNRTATFSLTKNWGDEVTPLTSEAIRESALHEVLHLLLARFYTLAGARFIEEEELREEDEAIVTNLVNYILDK